MKSYTPLPWKIFWKRFYEKSPKNGHRVSIKDMYHLMPEEFSSNKIHLIPRHTSKNDHSKELYNKTIK